jgi:hypothetical protein
MEVWEVMVEDAWVAVVAVSCLSVQETGSVDLRVVATTISPRMSVVFVVVLVALVQLLLPIPDTRLPWRHLRAIA